MFLDGLRPMIMLISKSWVPSSFNLRFFFPAFNGSASDNRPTPCIDKERQTSCTQMGNLEIVFHDFTLHFRAPMSQPEQYPTKQREQNGGRCWIPPRPPVYPLVQLTQRPPRLPVERPQ